MSDCCFSTVNLPLPSSWRPTESQNIWLGFSLPRCLFQAGCRVLVCSVQQSLTGAFFSPEWILILQAGTCPLPLSDFQSGLLFQLLKCCAHKCHKHPVHLFKAYLCFKAQFKFCQGQCLLFCGGTSRPG